MSYRLTVVVFALVFIFSALLAHAQITNVANDTITPIEGVGHDYIKMMSETVNPANGGLNIHIDMPVAKSRGLTVPFSITYDSNNVHHLNQGVYNNWGTVGWYANSSLLGQGGWTFALPYAHVTSWTENVSVLTGIGQGGNPIYAVYNCGNVGSYVMQDLSAVTHSLPRVGARSGGGSDPNNYCSSYTSSPGSDGKVEGFILAPYSGLNPPSLTVNDDVGTVYKFSTSAFKPDGSTDANSYAALPDSIEDRNGNIARLAINASKAVTVTDSSGRTSVSTSGFGPSGTTNNVTVSGETFQISWRTVSANFSIPTPQWAGFPGDPDPTYDICVPPGSASDTQTVISQITLPNGKFYKFYYGNDVTPHGAATNPYGLVSEIDYPTGAWATYSWKLSDTLNELVDYPGVYYQNCNVCSDCNGGPSGCPAPVADGCRYLYKTPVIASRRVSFGGSSPALTQSFVYNTNWGSGSLPIAGWISKTTTVTTTDNITGKTASTTYSYKPINGYNQSGGAVPPQVAVEQSEQHFDWNGTQLRTITKDWLDQFNMILDQTTNTAGGGISSQKKYTYVTNNTFFKEPQETDEYDFGASSPTRKTITTYQSFSGMPGSSGSPGALAGVPCKVVTTDGNGNAAAETDYLYDGGSAVCGTPGSAATADLTVTLASGTHDETLYHAGPGTPRANVTSVIKWLNGGTSPTTSYSYDKTGHVISATDARGNTTQYSYNDAYTILSGTQNITYTPTNGATNALLSKITDPLGHIATFKYDYFSSQLTSATDLNSQTTGYIYNDFFARPTQVNSPDGGQTNILYNDTAPNPSVTTCVLISGSSGAACSPITPPAGWKTTLATLDGMGHQVQSTLVSDPDGADITDTTYDGFGRVLTQSNPHRSASASTNGTTTYTYDALGRTTSVLKPDNSVVRTTYDQISPTATAICSSVVDEANRSRKSCVDGLGRLTQVFEDPSSANYETDYQYDVLGNLLRVDQKGGDPNSANWRTRLFTYDSLSRLLTASNPESGTITYTYDANGNVVTKTAPLPNQTNPSVTVTTTSQYDVLNRVTQKTYSDGTPTANFYYDSAPAAWATGEQNTVGRLVEATTGHTPAP